MVSSVTSWALKDELVVQTQLETTHHSAHSPDDLQMNYIYPEELSDNKIICTNVEYLNY